jgi:hypothetical protein
MQKLDMNTVAQGMKSDLSVFGKESAFAEATVDPPVGEVSPNAEESDLGSSIEKPFKNLHTIIKPDAARPSWPCLVGLEARATIDNDTLSRCFNKQNRRYESR